MSFFLRQRAAHIFYGISRRNEEKNAEFGRQIERIKMQHKFNMRKRSTGAVPVR